jgi:tRNA A-37 threonylcarbamoyl transferase component Bud32
VPEPLEPRPGEVWNDDYLIVRQLAVGRSGMGEVWEARETGHLKRRVVIKRVQTRHLEDEEFRDEARARFLRELDALGQIGHDNVVPVIHAADAPMAFDGEVHLEPFVVMAFIEGGDLHEQVKSHGRLEPGRAARLFMQAASALAAAHAKTIFHRDIKPANILIRSADDRLFVTDFGLAAIGGAPGLTSYGRPVGTEHYASREQLLGQLPEPHEDPVANAKSDVCGLGRTLYFALTGKRPEQRADQGKLPDVREEAPGVPAELASVVKKATGRVGGRYKSMDAFREALGRAVREARPTWRQRLPRFMPAARGRDDPDATSVLRPREHKGGTANVARAVVGVTLGVGLVVLVIALVAALRDDGPAKSTGSGAGEVRQGRTPATDENRPPAGEPRRRSAPMSAKVRMSVPAWCYCEINSETQIKVKPRLRNTSRRRVSVRPGPKSPIVLAIPARGVSTRWKSAPKTRPRFRRAGKWLLIPPNVDGDISDDPGVPFATHWGINSLAPGETYFDPAVKQGDLVFSVPRNPPRSLRLAYKEPGKKMYLPAKGKSSRWGRRFDSGLEF